MTSVVYSFGVLIEKELFFREVVCLDAMIFDSLFDKQIALVGAR